MKVPIDIEKCWRADEIRRLGLALRYNVCREKYRKAILDEMDLDLPDYERPTIIKNPIKNVKPHKAPWFKYMLP